MAGPAVYRPEPTAPAGTAGPVQIVIRLEVADAAELDAVLDRLDRRLPRRGVRVLGVETPLRT